jgi:hypothetical protein
MPNKVPEIRYEPWPKLNATLKPDCLFCDKKAVLQAVGSKDRTYAQMRCCTELTCMERAFRMAIVSLGGISEVGGENETETVAWLEENLKAKKAAWKKAASVGSFPTPNERTEIMASVPCHIRCWKSGGPVSVRQGHTCPNCGRESALRSVWDHLKDPLV